ncbi:MAG: ABC transporter ATP-binding protein, partial [Phyllobacterium sp.]
ELKGARAQAVPEAAKDVPGSREDRRKLSYKQKFALETLPGRIGALHEEIARLEERLADAGLFSRDPALFNRTAEAASGKRASLDALEQEWLELEMLREEIEG